MGQTWQGPALLTLLCQFQPLYSVSHDFWSLEIKGNKGTGIVVAIWHYAGIILFEPSRLSSGAFIFLLKMFPSAIPQFQWIGQPWFSWKSKCISVSPGSLFVLQWLCIQYQLQLIFARFFFLLGFFFCFCLGICLEVSNMFPNQLFHLIRAHIWSKETLILSPS